MQFSGYTVRSVSRIDDIRKANSQPAVLRVDLDDLGDTPLAFEAISMARSAKHFGAKSIVVLSGQMERFGREKKFQEAASLLPRMEQATWQVCDVLRTRV